MTSCQRQDFKQVCEKVQTIPKSSYILYDIKEDAILCSHHSSVWWLSYLQSYTNYRGYSAPNKYNGTIMNELQNSRQESVVASSERLLLIHRK